jgi:hypothetical protein
LPLMLLSRSVSHLEAQSSSSEATPLRDCVD